MKQQLEQLKQDISEDKIKLINCNKQLKQYSQIEEALEQCNCQGKEILQENNRNIELSGKEKHLDGKIQDLLDQIEDSVQKCNHNQIHDKFNLIEEKISKTQSVAEIKKKNIIKETNQLKE